MSRDLFAGVGSDRKRGSPLWDTQTGRTYPSRNKAYQALAPGLGLDPADQYGWYTLCRKFPRRFIDVRTGKPIGAHGRMRESEEVRMGPQGRLVIPADLRQALNVRPGDTLIAREEEGRLLLEKREHILARVKARYAVVPGDVSLVEELLAERRLEASREEAR